MQGFRCFVTFLESVALGRRGESFACGAGARRMGASGSGAQAQGFGLWSIHITTGPFKVPITYKALIVALYRGPSRYRLKGPHVQV